MKHDHDDSPRIDGEHPAPYITNPLDKQTREQPLYSGVEGDDSYEEPERDTDYTQGYQDHSIDDDYIDDRLDDGLDEDAEGALGNDEVEDEEYEFEAFTAGSVPGQTESEEDWGEPDMTSGHPDDDWLDDDDILDSENNDSRQPLPLGLIAVAVLALLLLTAGGYGVMQQRSATQEEIRQLQAALATAASPQDVSESRVALQETKERNAQLTAQISALRLENRRLGDTVAGLEAQLEAQQLAVPEPSATPAPAAVAPTPTKPAKIKTANAPAASKPAAGTWFVNFGSYSQRDVAQQWMGKIKPSSGRVITATGTRDGKTFYRVRVVDLTNRESADKVAAVLERKYGLPKLWIGQQ